MADTITPEVLSFPSAGTRTGKLGWVAADGRPLVAPVWFVVEDGRCCSTPAATPPRAARSSVTRA